MWSVFPQIMVYLQLIPKGSTGRRGGEGGQARKGKPPPTLLAILDCLWDKCRDSTVVGVKGMPRVTALGALGSLKKESK